MEKHASLSLRYLPGKLRCLCNRVCDPFGKKSSGRNSACFASKFITDSVDCLDIDRPFGVILDLLAEVLDMGVNDPVIAVEIFVKGITDEFGGERGMVDKAEQLLLDMGFHQIRVRIHDKLARLEVRPEDIEELVKEENRGKIYQVLKELGFAYVTLDLGGYRTGRRGSRKGSAVL